MAVQRATLRFVGSEWLRFRYDNVASSTFRKDRLAVRVLCEQLGEKTCFADIKPADIDRVLSARSEDLGWGAHNGFQAKLKTLFKWAKARGYYDLSVDPVDQPWKKGIKKQQRFIHVSKFPALLDEAEKFHLRDRMICVFGVYTLMRVNEISALRWEDVSLESGQISITRTKTFQTDLLPISAELDSEIRRWRTWLSTNEGPPRGSHYVVPALRQMVVGERGNLRVAPEKRNLHGTEVVRRALLGIGEDVSDGLFAGAHVLRRSGARALFDSLVAEGYDGALEIVQAWLGHTTVQSTEAYLGLGLKRQRRDALYRGNHMYPSLREENVIQLGEARSG